MVGSNNSEIFSGHPIVRQNFKQFLKISGLQTLAEADRVFKNHNGFHETTHSSIKKDYLSFSFMSILSPLAITWKSKCIKSTRETKFNEVFTTLFNSNLHHNSQITVLLRVQNKEQTLPLSVISFILHFLKFSY